MIDALRCSDYLQEGQLVSIQLQDPDDSEDAMTTFSGILGLHIRFGLKGACTILYVCRRCSWAAWYSKYEPVNMA